ncbi:MAG: cysteine desulfurase [Oscillospiraceae bacterium]|nr:cysteine desulfurase [Oscillospiraceae bacterium]
MIYADNAATTRLSRVALEAMLPFLEEEYGNPSSLYGLGQRARTAMNAARKDIASALGANPKEILFTSGGTESDNWALLSAAAKGFQKGKRHIVSTSFEHHAVLNTLNSLKSEGFDITLVNVSNDGIVRSEDIKNAIREDTCLVSVMYANNEIGTLQPIREIGSICKERGILFHSDAVQAVGHLPIDMSEEPVDLMSVSAHKFHGPKGVGLLYVRSGIDLPNLMQGGTQEFGKRPGTENLASIAGMAAALREAVQKIPQTSTRVSELRDLLIHKLSEIPHSSLNGDPVQRLPGNVNFCFEGVEGESLIYLLDQKGICASSGSACTSGSTDPSHVLLAIGRDYETAQSGLRLTLSEDITKEEILMIANAVSESVDTLRGISPTWKDLRNGKKPFKL